MYSCYYFEMKETKGGYVMNEIFKSYSLYIKLEILRRH